MGQKFPQANYRDVIKVAKKLEFCFYRQAKGSHEIWRRINGRYTTIPNHGSKSLKRKTLKGILEDFQITYKEFIQLKKGKRYSSFKKQAKTTRNVLVVFC